MAALIDVSHLAEIIPVIRTWWSNPFACLLKILTGTSSLICLGFTAAQRSLAKVAVSFQIIEMFNTVAPSPSSYSQSSGRRYVEYRAFQTVEVAQGGVLLFLIRKFAHRMDLLTAKKRWLQALRGAALLLDGSDHGDHSRRILPWRLLFPHDVFLPSDKKLVASVQASLASFGISGTRGFSQLASMG